MKELRSLSLISLVTVAVIFFLLEMAGHLSGAAMIPLALFLVVVLPVTLAIFYAKREHAAKIKD